ncbi:NADH dehydrogenase (ubiquinone) 1 beta subcomplex, 6 [Schistosoma haematobium]|uniref:NADH dehydrogenase (Ubiquinone) 1 beta subcomplex, 6 n=1 Tax=Schistosoma haematobium TaxID=6185 RepID=A0A922LM59_SCHHA|nr:NADH dehydrogenase (ubiquinone) 1 beta subcomplex, 6 [Schistosoma haematobium]KAH9589574.1 NADH dehydrogenase (ubiquinone) 1 beta subcomplex, 6 [Schistosoma haematobium]
MTSSSPETNLKIDPEVLEIQKKIYKELLLKQYDLKRGSKFLPIDIEPFKHQRHRLALPFTDEDRAARRQYLKDQLLSEREPVNVPEWTRVNIFRRIYRMPFDALTNLVRPIIVSLHPILFHVKGDHRSWYFRAAIPKVTCTLILFWFAWYRIKYCDVCYVFNINHCSELGNVRQGSKI